MGKHSPQVPVEDLGKCDWCDLIRWPAGWRQLHDGEVVYVCEPCEARLERTPGGGVAPAVLAILEQREQVSG